jgi:hypothetical protein
VKLARELGLPLIVLVKVPREALVEVLGGSLREAQSVALGVMGGALGVKLWEGVPGVASLGVGLRGEPVLGGTIREAAGKLMGVEPGEVGFTNSGYIGAQFWVISGQPITLVESTVKLGSICSEFEVWPWLTLRLVYISHGAEDEQTVLGTIVPCNSPWRCISLLLIHM